MRMASPGRLLLLLSASGILVGCSSFEQRVVAVESRQTAIEAQIADLQAAQQNIIGRLVQLRQELDTALQPLRTQSADRGEDVRALQRKILALEEQVAEVDNRIMGLTEQLASAPSSGGTPVGTAMPPPRGTPVRRDQGGGAVANSQATALFNSAFNDYLSDNYDLCIQGFEEYIRRFGSSERADDARYWIGQCQGDAGHTKAAHESFQTLIRDYPDSELVPDAALNDALLLEQEGKTGAAAEALRRLIRAYGASDAAFVACRELGKLSVERPPACEKILQ